MIQAFYIDLILGVPSTFSVSEWIMHAFTVESIEVNALEEHMASLKKIYVDGTDLLTTETGLGTAWDAFQFTSDGGSVRLKPCLCHYSLRIDGSYSGRVPAGKIRGKQYVLQIIVRGPGGS